MFKVKIGTLLVLFFLSVQMAICQNGVMFNLQDSLPIDTSVKVGSVDGGLSYYVHHDSVMEDIIIIKFVVKVGFEQETLDQLEFAHIVEHLALAGTSNFTNLIGYFSSQGIEFGKGFNGVTGFKETTYFFAIPSSKNELVRDCFRIIRDWIEGNVLMDSLSVEQQRKIVMREIDMHRNEGDSSLIRRISLAIGGVNHSGRLGLDTRNNIRNFSVNNLKRFYREWYRPELGAVLVFGAVDPDSVVMSINEVFSGLEARKVIGVDNSYLRPAVLKDKQRIHVFSDSSMEKGEVTVLVKMPFLIISSYPDVRRTLLIELFCQMLQFRLNYRFKMSGVMATDLYVIYRDIYSRYGLPFSAVELSVASEGCDVNSLVWMIGVELERIKKYGFASGEFSRALQMQNREALTDIYPSDLGLSLINNFIYGTMIFNQQQAAKFKMDLSNEIDISEVNDLGKDILDDGNTKFFISGERECELYPSDMSEKFFFRKIRRYARSKDFEVESYVQDNGSLVDGFRPVGEPVNPSVVNFERMDSIGIYKFVLNNSITVWVKAIDGTSDISLSMINTDLNVSKSRRDSIVSLLAENIVLRSGVGGYSRNRWIRFLADNNISIIQRNIYNSFVTTAKARYLDIEKLFQVSYMLFSNPIVDSTAVSVAKNDVRKVSTGVLGDPLDLYNRMMLDKGNLGSCELAIRYDDVKNISLEEICIMYDKLVRNSGGLHVFICGKVDSIVVNGLALEYLSSIPKNRGSEPSRLLKEECLPVGKKIVRIKSNSSAGARVNVDFNGVYTPGYNNEASIELLVILLRDFVYHQLRNVLGISYSPTVIISTAPRLASSIFRVSVLFDCPSSRVDEGVEEVRKCLSRLQTGDISEQTFRSAKAVAVSERARNVKNLDFWTDYSVSALIQKRKMSLKDVSFESIEKVAIGDIEDMSKTIVAENTQIYIME